jgi:acetylornithine deacetylase
MDALEYTRELVEFESTSVFSNVPITEYAEQNLRSLGFETERVDYKDVHGEAKANVVAKKGRGTGGVAFFGHTDVVPAHDWYTVEHGPFQPTLKNDRLYGRGSCDMKGSVACMLAAAAQFRISELSRPVYITLTADEEIGYAGASQVASRSELFREMAAGDCRGIIGEPTRLEVVYAHKGTCGFRAISIGKAAHSSTRAGLNANLAMIPFLVEMKKIYDMTEADAAWQNPEFDPPTVSWNIGVNDHTAAVNITPPQSVCTVYFRPMPGQDPSILLGRAARAARECGIEFHVGMRADPLYVDPQSPFVREMLEVTGKSTARTVSYGTDGARFGALKNLVVYGPGDIARAHTFDEWVTLDELTAGTEAFGRLIRRWCCDST